MTDRYTEPPRPLAARSARWRNLLASLVLTVATLILLLGLLELGVRVFVPDSRWRFEDGSGDWRLDDEIGWVNRPNLDVTIEEQNGPVRYRTNADGLAPSDATRERTSGTARIMVFGDSMTVGRVLPQDQIYTARLAEILRARGIAAEVVNAGVQGYSTDQALLLLQRWVPAYRPDLVIHGSTLNDFGGIALDTANGQAKPRFRFDEHGRLRLSMPRLSARIRPIGRGGLPRWIQRSALYRLIQPGLFVLRARFQGSDERVLIGDFPEVYFRSRAADGFDWRLYGALVARMRDVAQREGARFLFFEHPDPGEVWSPFIELTRKRFGVPEGTYDPYAIEQRLAAIAEERGVSFLPTVDAFRAAADRGPFHFLPTDPHLNRAGHALLAEILSETVETSLASRVPAR